jgi:glutamyl endopeptidase
MARSEPMLGSANPSAAEIAATGAELAGQESAPLGGLNTVAYGNAREARRPRSIIGFDARMRTYTTRYPNSAIVYITRNGVHWCTGWMISSNTLATAGHCVHPGGGGTSRYYPASQFRVYPGYDGSGAGPYGSCTVRRTHSVVGWSTNGNRDFDYGAMRLNCTIGFQTGAFGYYAPTQSTLLGQPIVTAGYPGDKPRTQWTSSDIIRSVSSFRVFYRADTVGGQSGSPVWNEGLNATFTSGVYAFAVHAYGVGASNNNTNSAPWLNPTRVTNYNGWRLAP